jgi:hypothetical protein
MHRLVLLVGLLLPASAWAQSAAPTSFSRAYVGVKAGTGLATSPTEFVAQNLTGGISGGYILPKARLTLQMDALLERRPTTEWDAQRADAFLFVPVYLHTGTPANRVHFLLGVGPTFRLTHRGQPDAGTPYTQHNTELTLLHGVEIRLMPVQRYETTLALTMRTGLTPAYSDYRDKKSTFLASTSAHEEHHVWFGATLNVYLHRDE